MGCIQGRHRLRGTLGNHVAAAGTALGPQVDDPVRGLDHVEIVLDDDHRIALVAEPVEHLQKLGDIVKVQPGGGLIEDVERRARAALGKFLGELDALRLAPGQRRGTLPQLDITQPDGHQRVEFGRDPRHVSEKRRGFLDRHLQHVVNRLALVADIQRFAVVALALADVAGHVDVRQEMHLHLDDAVALAGLAAPAPDVEAEPSGPVAAGA